MDSSDVPDPASAPGASLQAPLEGLRVVELAHVMAGPVCGLMLADLGADVVKVEPPNGDPARGFLPPEMPGSDGESAAFAIVNRNKRGVVLDLKKEPDVAKLLVLLERTDVVIENFRPGTMERLGLGYDKLHELYPRLIYCQITGFGLTGPLAAEGGFDLIAQGYSGLMSVTGEGPGRPPVKCGVPVADITAGLLGALGVLSALHQRQRTGSGQRVDSSLFEAGVFTTFWQSAIALASGTAPGATGSAHPLNAPYQAFRTADGWINVGTSNQANWERLPLVIGLPELADDRRYADNIGRVEHREELVETLQAAFIRRPTDEWLERLREARIPCGPVLDILQMLAHPQTLARGMVVDLGDGGDGGDGGDSADSGGRAASWDRGAAAQVYRTLGVPIHFSDATASVRRRAPKLGEHTAEVLREIEE